jgi:uncharacterized membrane protein YoaK (UPF0700 family)
MDTRMNSPAVRAPTVPSMSASIRRVVALSAVAGYVEVIGFMDFGGIYPGIMTGNTVQLGLTLAKAQWARFGLIGFAVALFFLGGIVASLIKRHLPKAPWGLVFMAAALVVASLVRVHTSARIPYELPLLAFALAMQGDTISTFGGVSIQTIVVTNNMVKFSDALVGRYLMRAQPGAHRPALQEVLLPGLAWLTYSVSAGIGALAAAWLQAPLLVPAVLLGFIVADLLRTEA